AFAQGSGVRDGAGDDRVEVAVEPGRAREGEHVHHADDGGFAGEHALEPLGVGLLHDWLLQGWRTRGQAFALTIRYYSFTRNPARIALSRACGSGSNQIV